jgi:hypothetical protein
MRLGAPPPGVRTAGQPHGWAHQPNAWACLSTDVVSISAITAFTSEYCSGLTACTVACRFSSTGTGPLGLKLTSAISTRDSEPAAWSSLSEVLPLTRIICRLMAP